MPVKHGEPKASKPGVRRWMNAVAIMTPDPKYLAKLESYERMIAG